MQSREPVVSVVALFAGGCDNNFKATKADTDSIRGLLLGTEVPCMRPVMLVLFFVAVTVLNGREKISEDHAGRHDQREAHGQVSL